MRPIVAQSGLVRVELRSVAYGDWDVTVNGDPAGTAWLAPAGVFHILAGAERVICHSIERAAVILADRLNDGWGPTGRPLSVFDVGRPSGEVA